MGFVKTARENSATARAGSLGDLVSLARTSGALLSKGFRLARERGLA